MPVPLDLEQIDDDGIELLYEDGDTKAYTAAFADAVASGLRDESSARRLLALEIVCRVLDEIHGYFASGCMERHPGSHESVISRLGETLADLVTDAVPEIRITAVDVLRSLAGLRGEWARYLPFDLGWLAGTEPALRAMVETGDPAVAAAGLRGLTAIAAASAVPLGRGGLIHAAGSVRAAATDALAAVDDLTIDELVALAADEAADVRLAAIQALGSHGWRIGTWTERLASGLHERVTGPAGPAGTVRRYVADALVGALDDPDSRVRASTIHALAAVDVVDAGAPIAVRLVDPVLEVRRAAACALRELGTPAQAPALADALADREVRTDVALTLEHFATPACVPQILVVLGERLDPGPYEALIRSLCTAGGPEAAPTLRELARSEQALRLRAEVLHGMARSRMPEFAAAARRALKTDKTYLHRAALDAIGAFGDPALAPDARRFLDDPHARHEAALALARLDPALLADDAVRGRVLAPLLERKIIAAHVGYGFVPASDGLLAIARANPTLALPSQVRAEIVQALHVAIETATTVNCQTSYAAQHRADVRRFMASAGACVEAWLLRAQRGV